MTTLKQDNCELAITIIQQTNDGSKLSPEHLKLVENAVNGYLNENGQQAFEQLYKDVVSGRYVKPYLNDVENITINHEGYVYWKDKQIEHFNFSYAWSIDAIRYCHELRRRCLYLEEHHIEVSCQSVVWKWDNKTMG